MSKVNKITKIGIDCYKLEDLTGSQRAGVGRHLYKLLEEISKRPQLAKEFKFYLYFNCLCNLGTSLKFLDPKIDIQICEKIC